MIDIHGLNCANSDGRDESLQRSYGFLKIGKLRVKFKFVFFVVENFINFFVISTHVCLLKSHDKALKHEN